LVLFAGALRPAAGWSLLCVVVFAGRKAVAPRPAAGWSLRCVVVCAGRKAAL